MAIQKIIVYLSNPRKDDGETLRCCQRNGWGIEPRPFPPKKGLWLTLSVVCLAGLNGYSIALATWGHWSEIGE